MHVKMMLRVRSVPPHTGDSMGYLNRTVPYDGGTVQDIAVYPVCNKTCHWNFTRWLGMKSNLLPLFHKGLAMALSLDWDLPSAW